MISLEEARARVLAIVKRTGEETVPLKTAHGRICSRKIIAPGDLPSFDTSDTDGYAVITSDVLNATNDEPAVLQLVGIAKPGEHYEKELNSGECVQVFAGSRIPIGADAVVPLGFGEHSQTQENIIRINYPSRPWQNIRKRGEDLMYGTMVANVGDKLTTGQIAALSALGVKDVSVARQLRIHIISIGSELRKPDENIKPGQIYESNSLLIGNMVKKFAAQDIQTELIEDNEEEIYSKINMAFESSDVVITTGRASEGKLDILKNALAKIPSLKFEYMRVMMKPGRPFIFGMFNSSKYLFGLPGNPVSAAVSYSLLIRPALMKIIGASNIELPSEEGELIEEIRNPGKRRYFARVKIDEHKRIKLAGLQTSYGLGSLFNANGIVDVPPHTVLQKGAIVKVLKWEVAE
ncbi:MAG: molybdopterin molybdotransferase MoeA [Verrucomicrobiae bacterium]|nr:molybdopterin molybdotransferase MoeA [Verrucomicrobiae bacterium]